ncbi:MAG: AAA family ATPase, partial [SAR202 cluster bacterium]|nr:AAA family ATPase [SAR202 cluster bacterium]
RNTIIVMTSNIGSDLIRQDRSIGFLTRSDGSVEESAAYERMKSNVLDEVKRFFRPEFLNRIDGTVVFHALSRSHMEDIVNILMKEVSSNLLEKGISLEVTDAAREWLAEEGYDPTFGARPLRRLIQDTVEDKLSDALLAGEIGPADTAIVDLDENDLIIKTETPASLTSSSV